MEKVNTLIDNILKEIKLLKNKEKWARERKLPVAITHQLIRESLERVVKK